MSMMKRPIFRERAIQRYKQGREKDVLPRFVSPPVFLFLWIILGLSLVGGWLVWTIRIPVFTPAIGTVVESSQDDRALALLFAPSDQLHNVHPGTPVRLQLGSTSLMLLTITTVAPTLLSPTEVRQQYHLDGALALLVTEPSVVMGVALTANISASSYAGSIVRAQVEVGDVSILFFVPLVGQLFGA